MLMDRCNLNPNYSALFKNRKRSWWRSKWHMKIERHEHEINLNSLCIDKFKRFIFTFFLIDMFSCIAEILIIHDDLL